ncbi:restriction endonuclease subunit S [Bacillus sp. JJ783]|uniref:restriction endonuclease subunit S n=1 Tax=Bacillus sp. JJ783 TaxID=3122974 RepID=UPI0030007354
MTDNNQYLVPEIRFKRFTNAWEQREYGEVIDLLSGQDFSPSEYNDTCNGIPYMTGASCIVGKETIVNRWTTVPRCLAEKGDVLLVCKGSGYGAIAVLAQDKAHIARQFMALKNLPNLDKVFNYYLLNSVIENIKKDARGLIAGIARDAVLKQKISIPLLEEQSRIGTFFAQLDNLITLHKRKLDGLVTLKDGFLQQMFPAANEVMPRVRFTGFTGNWEERRLEEMLTERNEQIEESEDYPLMSFVGNVGVVPKGEQYDRSFLVKGDGKKYKKTELNDFIYSSNNLETGSIGINRTGKAVISPVYSIFYSSNDSESLFVGLLSKRKDFINKMIRYRQGIMYGQWRIHERDFLKIIVLAPTISEQNRIIDFFKNFDEQIAVQTAKLEQLRQLKAAYLQRMFI